MKHRELIITFIAGLAVGLLVMFGYRSSQLLRTQDQLNQVIENTRWMNLQINDWQTKGIEAQ